MEMIDISYAEKWDSIVKSFTNYDIYYLSGYVKAFQIHGDGVPLLFFYEKNGAKAMCVLMKRDVANDNLFKGKIEKNRYFDAVTPYGYGGFIFDGKVNISDLDREFSLLLKDNGINSLFFRFHPVLNNASENENLSNVIPLGNTIAMDLTSPEVIWSNLTSKNRNMIRKADKSGVEIHHSDNPELLISFKEIYDETMREDNAENYYFFNEKFYQSIANDLTGNFEIFYATLDDKIISIAIMIFANGRMHYHLSGSLRKYRSLAPSNLLLYQAALWGCEQGFETFHLGGGVGSEQDPLYKFKAAFNRNSDYSFAIGKRIVNKEDYNYLIKVRHFSDEFVEGIKYFPQYRARLE